MNGHAVSSQHGLGNKLASLQTTLVAPVNISLARIRSATAGSIMYEVNLRQPVIQQRTPGRPIVQAQTPTRFYT